MHQNNQFNYDEPEDTTNEKELELLRSNYINTFKTEAGKIVLDDLYKFLDQPVADPNYSHKFAYYREGQNQIVRRIQQLIGEPNNDRRKRSSRFSRNNRSNSKDRSIKGAWRKFIRKLKGRS